MMWWLIGAIVWTFLAVLLGFMVGSGIRIADQGGPK